MAGNSTQITCKSGHGCKICKCTGRSCPNMYPGLKVQWPELKGVSAVDAKKIIEQDNQYVTAWIYPETQKFVTINCCNRVILFTPTNDCPNGPVLNSPFVG
ncbi:uncharacterized protein LOC130757179 [Actinidia eriantha]|uniref:uncharacterized protein LOC130757179 n=1 Tax=Actinidia eriantha TaxID=165200 RepID=UPI00258EA7E5|nr:uncharacterized protein LOC130757179 [Actinidia eriantha]